MVILILSPFAAMHNATSSMESPLSCVLLHLILISHYATAFKPHVLTENTITSLFHHHINRDNAHLPEPHCEVSYAEDTCVSVKLDDGSNFQPFYAGPNGAGVVVCGAENEVAPDPFEDDFYSTIDTYVDSKDIVSSCGCFIYMYAYLVISYLLLFLPSIEQSYANQKRGVFLEVILSSPDQLCQKTGWSLQKIFATSTATNKDPTNSGANIQVLDNFMMSCHSPYKEVIKRASFNEEMGRQLTFNGNGGGNKAVLDRWHNDGKLVYPDENYARENLQLVSPCLDNIV